MPRRRQTEIEHGSTSRRGRGVPTVPTAPAVPRGHQRTYGIRSVNQQGKKWYRNHDESKYWPDVPLDRDTLIRECPQIIRRLNEL